VDPSQRIIREIVGLGIPPRIESESRHPNNTRDTLATAEQKPTIKWPSNAIQPSYSHHIKKDCDNECYSHDCVNDAVIEGLIRWWFQRVLKMFFEQRKDKERWVLHQRFQNTLSLNRLEQRTDYHTPGQNYQRQYNGRVLLEYYAKVIIVLRNR